MNKYEELLLAEKELKAEILKVRGHMLKESFETIRTAMANANMTEDELIHELCPAKSKPASTKKGSTVPAKFKSPDSLHEWSGRGNLPTWIKELIDKDNTLTKESFRIK